VDAAAGRAKIMIDGSICRGTDIVKAIALGADLVGIGRMQCFALGAAGQAGIVRLLELLEDEVQRTLGLLGVTGFAEIDKSYLHYPAPLANAPHVLSQFPLIKIDDYRY
jgi:glycolate oxidase